MLLQRLATSAVLIGVITGLIFLDARYPLAGIGGLWLMPALACFALGTAWDMTSLMRSSGRLLSAPAALTATATVSFSACVPWLWPLLGQTYPLDCPIGRLGWLVVGSVMAIFGILVVEMVHFGKPVPAAAVPVEKTHSATIERTSSALFVSLYVGLPMALMVVLRTMGEGLWGLAALLTMIAVTKSADAGAYFTGKALGRHKLIPRLSPGKTVEGAVGGIVVATIVAFVCLRYLFPAIADGAQVSTSPPAIAALVSDWWGACVLGPMLAAAGMVGDLAESLIKRDAGAKDSGKWLPGLGGVWDVTDSLLAAILPAFLCFAAGVAN